MLRLTPLFGLTLAATLAAGGEEPPYPPTSRYEVRKVEGFTVLVHPDVLARKEDAAEAFRELEAQLRNVRRAVPESRLEALTKVRVWVEWEKKKNGAAEFHVSKGWLKGNGYNPDKLHGVEINNARNFVRWSRQDQPWMVLHELAHAYHHIVLGVDHPGVRAAYEQAMERRLYDAVAHVRGGKARRAYAAANRQEYFAELSEAYFGKNDFFPFTRADLEKHDPVGHRALREVWGEPRVAADKTLNDRRDDP